MKSNQRAGNRQAGYALMEALVYISLVSTITVTGFLATYRFIDSSVVLRRNAQDIALALNSGELWRADVRAAVATPALFVEDSMQILEIPLRGHTNAYHFGDSSFFRRVDSGPWVRLIKGVASCQFIPEQRQNASGWRCELELMARVKGINKGSRVRPLFTFLAATSQNTNTEVPR